MLAIFFGLFSTLAHAHSAPEIIYVNAHNTASVENGKSWKTAFSSLQDALDKAATLLESQIWVAEGTYTPTKIYAPSGVSGGAYGVASPNLATFNLPDHVSIFGGFCGNESDLAQRNPKKFPTILSGNGFNWHVVIAGNDISQTGVTARLDGLTITQGNAQGPAAPGGGPLFQPFVYEHSSGGGLYAIFGSHISIDNVIFSYNIAGPAGGLGGAILASNSDICIKKSLFEFNTAAVNAGGVQILDSFTTVSHKALIEDSKFEQNSAGLFGGAVVGEGSQGAPNSFLEIKNCEFAYNRAQVGGAFAVDSLRVDIQDSCFSPNIASVAGGALSTTNVVNTFVFALNPASAFPFVPFTTTVCRTDFINNEAQGNLVLHDSLFGGPAVSGIDFPLGGGAIAVYVNGYLDVDSAHFSHNKALNSDGGAILNGRSAGQNILGTGAQGFIANSVVRNSSFESNSSPINGGAIASEPSTFFPTLPITVASTFLLVEKSSFDQNSAGLNGGGIYLNLSTAKLLDNLFKNNKSISGKSIFAIDSLINHTFYTLFIDP